MTVVAPREPAAPPPWRPVATLAAALAATVAIVVVAQWLFAAAGPGLAPLGPALVEALFTLLVSGALLGVALVGGVLDGTRMRAGASPLRMALLGGLVGLGGLAAAAGIGALAGLIRSVDGAGVEAGALLVGTVAIAAQAAAEELFFRGWLQASLARAWGAVPALLVAAAVFAALHLAGGARAPLSLFNLFLGGVLFGLLMLRGGGLVAPVAAHIGWNWAEQILLGLDPNPGIGNYGAVANLDLVGSALWGGSDEGLNASIAATVVLVALIVPLAAWRRKSASPPAPGR